MLRTTVLLWFALWSIGVAGGRDVEGTIEFGGRTRSYLLHLPPQASSHTPLPLVVVLHGGGSNARSAAVQTGFSEEADRHGFLVLYPNGTGSPRLMALGRGKFYTWNAGTCCGYAAQQNVDDVGFIGALIAQIAEQYSVDRKRIYAAGISNGGMMAYRLACELSETFAAIGVVAGTVACDSCNLRQPVSVIHIHGTADNYVPLNGGVGTKSLDRTPKRSVLEAVQWWAQLIGAPSQPIVTRFGRVTTYTYSSGSAEVVLHVIDGGGHAWPGGKRMLLLLDPPPTDFAATPLLWSFFAAHPKQEPH